MPAVSRLASPVGQDATPRLAKYYEDLREVSERCGVAAEVEAKTAFFDGRWHSAVSNYDRWLAFEPNNSEARFERAAALKNSGQLGGLGNSAPGSGVRHGAPALRQPRWRGTSTLVAQSFSYSTMSSSANGYDGQRLLNLKTEGGRVNLTITGHPNLKVGASVDQVRASSDADPQRGSGGVVASYLFGPRVSVDARACAWVFNTNATFEAQALGMWNATDRLNRLRVSTSNRCRKNLEHRRAGAHGGGSVCAAQGGLTKHVGGSARFGQRLSDGNNRTRFTANAAVSSASACAVFASSAGPRRSSTRRRRRVLQSSRFVRVDGGLAYTHLVENPIRR